MMGSGKKNKKLILLITSLSIIVWFVYFIFSSLFTKISFYNSQIHNITEQKSTWLNSGRDIEAKDLENRIILLDFWTFACVNCLHSIPEIKKLETQFGDRLTVIGVHSGKFNNEKDSENIKKAILKYDISHLVVNDADFKIWNNFAVSSWPTFVLIDPKGEVIKKYQGEITSKNIESDIKKLIKKYKYQLNNNKLPIVLEKNKAVDYVLKFPSKIEFARDFSYKNINKTNALIIANSGKNNIIVTTLNGETLLEIGSQNTGQIYSQTPSQNDVLQDTDIENVTFNSPRGLLFKDNVLYVADTGNHALRRIDFKSGTVKTIIGNGKRGEIISSKTEASKASLASPWDLEFFPDKNHIIIANSGTHQLLKYDISEKTISPFAGNGEEDLIDGKYPQNSLAQPSGLSAVSVKGVSKLYFVDAETSSLREIDAKGQVKTLIGKGLFDFGHINGKSSQALMQHPTGLAADDQNIYIADTLNNVIRKYNLKSGEISDYSGNVRGVEIGSKKNTSYDGPEAIISVLDKFYVADTNNNRIVELGANSSNAKLLDIIPKLKMPTEGLLEYLPNLNKIDAKKVKSGSEIIVSFNMKDGWKINELAPSFFNLIEVKNEKEANLIASFDSSMIKSLAIKLPKLSKKYHYYLQGTVYYCEEKENALCLIRSYEQKLEPAKLGEEKIQIDFIYQ